MGDVREEPETFEKIGWWDLQGEHENADLGEKVETFDVEVEIFDVNSDSDEYDKFASCRHE